jgi:ubiquinone/menaquinone biosynthesis C-methylase UbiE
MLRLRAMYLRSRSLLSRVRNLLVPRALKTSLSYTPWASAAPSPISPPALALEIEQTGEWWRLLPFTLYRIRIGDDLWTTPAEADGVNAARDVRMRIVLDLCGGSLAGKTIADLGCNEGGFAVEFARLGAKESVGIEARDVSVQRCELVRKLAGLENLKFIRCDVMEELARWSDSFDIVFASGILYHVADPHKLLSDIFRACREAVLIDTAVASREAPSHWCSEEIVSRTFGDKSYQGRIFPEPDASIRESKLWSAWSNDSSFWLLEDELLSLMRDVGFRDVRKVDRSQYGDLPWGVDPRNRIIVVGKK